MAALKDTTINGALTVTGNTTLSSPLPLGSGGTGSNAIQSGIIYSDGNTLISKAISDSAFLDAIISQMSKADLSVKSLTINGTPFTTGSDIKISKLSSPFTLGSNTVLSESGNNMTVNGYQVLRILKFDASTGTLFIG